MEATTAKAAKFNKFDVLIIPDDTKDITECVNPNSWEVLEGFVEGANVYSVGNMYQFIRDGYYRVDEDTTADNLVFNCTVSLKSNFKPN